MSNCNGNCDTCKTECTIRCPICNATTTIVPIDTVKSICINKNIIIDENTYICLNRKCEVTYFNSKLVLYKKDLSVPVWFKEPMSEMIVCYCYNITLKEIVNTVKKYKVYTKSEIIKLLNKEHINKDCLHHNPIGKDCDILFNNAIEYAKGVE